MNRYDINKKILSKLLEYFEKNPDSRFNQGLVNLGFTDSYREQNYDKTLYYDIVDFYEESSDTLSKVNSK